MPTNSTYGQMGAAAGAGAGVVGVAGAGASASAAGAGVAASAAGAVCVVAGAGVATCAAFGHPIASSAISVSAVAGAGAVTVGANSDIRIAGGTWAGDYTSGIKIQPTANDSYFQFQGALEFRKTNGASAVTISQAGDLTASGNVTAYSDARLKTDISTINDALGICGKLRGVSYKWLKDGSAGIGVIAQEVEEVIPEVVLTNVNTDPATGEEKEIKSVDYGKIVGVLINAINELKAEIDELKGGK